MSLRLRVASVVVTSAALFAFTGCTASVTRTVSAESVATAAAGALEDQYGITVDAMDCGEDAVPYADGSIAECVVTVDGEDSDATVTLAEVDGDDYKVNVNVPQASWLEPTPTTQAPPEGEPGDAGTLTVYAYELADVAEGALESQYGARPTILCDGDKLELSVGAQFECKLVEAKTGARGVATVSVTEIDGSAYSIKVDVVDE